MFEAVSAITITGLSMHASTEGLPRTFLFARAWMQWYGDLGVVVLSLALLLGHEMAARRLSDSSGSCSNTQIAPSASCARQRAQPGSSGGLTCRPPPPAARRSPAHRW